jgi:hypothetical protein
VRFCAVSRENLRENEDHDGNFHRKTKDIVGTLIAPSNLRKEPFVPTRKRYTTQTFTKRVDHDGGLHRKPRLPDEPAYCEKCGAIFRNRRWVMEVPVTEKLKRKPFKPANVTKCPACKQMEEGVVGGYVSLSGKFLSAHFAEVESLLRNEEAQAIEDNPLSRIMKWNESADGKLLIETTTEHLAQRFGRALEKAFSGNVNYDFSHENKVARVAWHRD